MNLLRLGSGGRLVYDRDWDCEPEDVTARAHQFLFHPVAVPSSFKVRDLLSLMHACPELPDIYGRWFVRDFLDDAELGSVEQTGPIYARIQFLQLETVWEKSDNGDFLEYDGSLDLSGYSAVQRVDRISHTARKGERIQYSMEGSLRPYLDLPLRVKPDIGIFKQGSVAPNSVEPYDDVRRDKATLGRIIEGFFYSVSTLGPPEKFDATMREMLSLTDDPGAWHSINLDDLSTRMEQEQTPWDTKMCILLDQFLSRYPAKAKNKIEEEIRNADDDTPIGKTLQKKFGMRLTILPAFAELSGCEFRELYRAKRRQCLA